MAPFASKKLCSMSFGIAEDQRKRLKRHAHRTGMDMTDIMRIALGKELDDLDEKERLSKNVRKPYLAAVPEKTSHGSGPVRGLKLKKTMPVPVFKFTPPAFKKPEPSEEDFSKLFPKYAEFLEKATDRSDSEVRAQKVIDDIKARAKSKDESQTAYDALMAFMKLRSESRKRFLEEDTSKLEIFGGDSDEE
jgi:hypothetical protein